MPEIIKRENPSQGFLLITALLVTTGLATLLTVIAARTATEVLVARNSAAGQQALHNAEAGLDCARSVLAADFLDGGWSVGNAGLGGGPITPSTVNPTTGITTGTLPGPLPNPGQDSFAVTVTAIPSITPVPGPGGIGVIYPVNNGTVFQLQSQGFHPLLQTPRQITVVAQAFNPWPYAIYLSGAGAPLGAGQVGSRLIKGTLSHSIAGTRLAIGVATPETGINWSGVTPSNMPHLLEVNPGFQVQLGETDVQVAEVFVPVANGGNGSPGLIHVPDTTTSGFITTGSAPNWPPTSIGALRTLPPDTPWPSSTLGHEHCNGSPQSTWPNAVVNASGQFVVTYPPANPLYGGNTFTFSSTDFEVPNYPPPPGVPPSNDDALCFKSLTIDGGVLEFSEATVVSVDHLTITNGGRFVATNHAVGVQGYTASPSSQPPSPSTLIAIAPPNADPAQQVALKIEGDGAEFSGVWYGPHRAAELATTNTSGAPETVSFTGGMAVEQLTAGLETGDPSTSSQANIIKTPLNVGLFFWVESMWCEGTCLTPASGAGGGGPSTTDDTI